jgi:hypothetical protein
LLGTSDDIAGSVKDLLTTGLAAVVMFESLMLLGSGGASTPFSDAEPDSSSRVSRFFLSSIMRLTVSSSSPRSRKLVSEMVSVRFDTKGLLVTICFLTLLSFFFFIGAGLLES